ncbi:hypothetical protein [Streptomyces sp. E5N91]|uniref:hypothetical protein n=1 Tax=Streptomyces sp. E5N91 TaxID=1851996 RepID=UPI001EE97054|nr:hypothetical protein [Streptomyces sp. E5N91]
MVRAADNGTSLPERAEARLRQPLPPLVVAALMVAAHHYAGTWRAPTAPAT